ncbi:uncharacterized protein B0P05DRAFT_559162 [Gilbertella persicaria]|uniref:uncharacterized protein n=1 Tax=Gilbertella persicaria TaxID=101096 RepID=UPI00221F41E4|nr:uncharacterized protein B0P05DRAFT_559162 [Gilbertella persicaria]KAI8058951.1 hypothetical protein B0P05DRAFT_559162 [Gilbertella persicaria]
MEKRKASNTNNATAVSIASTSEESFPRGGASALTPLEHREISNKVARDLFNTENKKVADEEPPKKKRKPSKTAKKTEVKEQKKTKSDKAYIEQLTFKKLTVGTSFLGCISRINELDLLVSLPHQLVGVVAINEISDPLTALAEKVANQDDDEDEEMEESGLPQLNQLFHVGQWVRCRIINLQSDDKKTIELSLKPSVVNEDIVKDDITPGVTLGATVKSVEDHGYILDLGVKDLAGFLPLKESKSYIQKFNREEELAVGQYVECAVQKVAGRTVNVTIDRTKVGCAFVEDPFSRITSVLPGQLVTGLSDVVQNNGLSVKLQGLYPTTIDQSHIPTSIDIEKNYKLGQSLTFRTLFTMLNTEDKKIAGSLLTHVLELDVPTVANNTKSDKFVADLFPTGSFLENVKVTRTNSSGVWMTLDGVEGISGYVHVSRLADEHINSVSGTSGKFKIGTTHRARILGYNPVDALLVLTLQPSVLAEKFLRVADIEVGSTIECEVEKLVPAGVIVKVSKSITGLVPTNHMADVKLTRPEYKFKTGKKIQCRVLSTEPDRQKVFLTLKKSLINSEYPIFKDIHEIKVGDVSHGVIISIKNNGCVVGYYNNLRAFVPAKEMTETRVDDLSQVFNIGQTVKTTVLSVDPEENRMLSSFINTKKKAEKKAESKAKLDAKHEAKNDALAPGRLVTATIKSVKKSHLTLTLPNNTEGRLHISEVFNSFDEIKNLKAPLSEFRSKQEIEVRILGVRNTKLNTYLPITRASKVKQHLECSLRLHGSEDDSAREMRNIKAGDEFIGFISDIHTNYITVSIGSHTSGTLQKNLASTDINVCNNLTKHFINGQAIRVAALVVDSNKSSIDFMHLEDPNMPRITDVSALEEGQIMNATVQRINKVNGLVLTLTSKIAGKAYLTELADTYTEEPTSAFQEGQVVRVAVVHVNADKHQVDLSLRPSRIYPGIESNEIKTFADIKRGHVYEGYVSNIAPQGVFVKLNHSIVARVKIANLSDTFVKEWKDVYKLGQLVKAKIIYIDYDMQRLEASLKKSVVEGAVAAEKKSEQQAEESDSDEEMPEVDEDSDEEMQEQEEDDKEESDEEEEKEESDKEESDEEEEETSTAALNIDNFDWTGINNRADSSDEEDDDDDDDSDDDGDKKNKKKKEVPDWTAELNSQTPQTANDYERLLVGSPNSSYLWINYMAYHLRLSEVSKARDIGARALKTINFREEQEKMNVWVALLNLENNFGTDESLQEVVKRALIYCDPLKVYVQLAKIYERSEKDDKAVALYEEMTKKFGQSPKVWLDFALYCLKHNKAEQSRELLQKSLKALPKHEHVLTIVKFARLEFNHGEAERGRTILEGVMSNNPKRLDLWNVYLDLETKTGDVEMTR